MGGYIDLKFRKLEKSYSSLSRVLFYIILGTY